MNAVAAFGPEFEFDVEVATGVGEAVTVTAGVAEPPPPPPHAARSDAVTISAAAAGANFLPVMDVHRSETDPDGVGGIRGASVRDIRRVDLVRSKNRAAVGADDRHHHAGL